MGFKKDVDVNLLKDELKDLIFFDPAKLFNKEGKIKNIYEIPEKERKAIKSFKVRETLDGGYIYDIQLHNKIDAIVNLAKHLGFYEEDNLQQAGDNNFTVVFASVDDIKNGKVKEAVNEAIDRAVKDDDLDFLD